jgi:putative transposase
LEAPGRARALSRCRSHRPRWAIKKTKSLYHGHRFPAAVISHAVRCYFRFQLSLRDIEELLFKRGVTVSHETIRRRCDRFGAGFAHRVKAARRKPGSTWHLDEVFVTLCGQPDVLWRAVDQLGVKLDILLQKRRDEAAAKRFFKRVLAAPPDGPTKIVTDRLRSYPAARTEIPELANVGHVFVKASARVNKRGDATSPRVNASAACAASWFLIVHRLSCRASGCDPAALRAQATFTARLVLSQTPRSTL